MLSKDVNPEHLDYDSYWNNDVKANVEGFELVSRAEHTEALRKWGFFVQESQRSMFEETGGRKDLRKGKKG